MGRLALHELDLLLIWAVSLPLTFFSFVPFALLLHKSGMHAIAAWLWLVTHLRWYNQIS
jgi:hypothetical protein